MKSNSVDESRLLIAIMSYNRGEFLENLIQSIKALFHFKYELYLFDDSSDDPYTLEVLERFKEHVVSNVSQDHDHNIKHKGLYANMNRALEMSYKSNVDYLMIFQDDTQVIRKVNASEIERYTSIFRKNNIAQLVCTFFKKNHQKPYFSLLSYEESTDAFYPLLTNRDYMLGIADMGIYDIKSLKKVNWFFENNELENQNKGKKLGLNRAVLRFPFLAYLPWPAVFRYKGSFMKRRFMRFSDWYFKAGFHPLQYLTDQETSKIMNDRSPTILFEEDILIVKNSNRLKEPWNFYQSTFEWKRRVKSLLRLKQHNNQ
uniref:glycosyltransferase family A protein n=4 Tax=Roseivirga sp. TaxID=1964215 RepID=UPI0040482096